MSITSIVSSGRRLIGTTFLDRAFISDRTEAKDSTGGTTQAWIERSEPTPCRFVALSDDVAEQANGTEFGQATAILLAPLGTVIPEGVKVRNVADGPDAEPKWIVTRDITPPSALAIAVRVGIREI